MFKHVIGDDHIDALVRQVDRFEGLPQIRRASRNVGCAVALRGAADGGPAGLWDWRRGT